MLSMRNLSSRRFAVLQQRLISVKKFKIRVLGVTRVSRTEAARRLRGQEGAKKSPGEAPRRHQEWRALKNPLPDGAVTALA